MNYRLTKPKTKVIDPVRITNKIRSTLDKNGLTWDYTIYGPVNQTLGELQENMFNYRLKHPKYPILVEYTNIHNQGYISMMEPEATDLILGTMDFRLKYKQLYKNLLYIKIN